MEVNAINRYGAAAQYSNASFRGETNPYANTNLLAYEDEKKGSAGKTFVKLLATVAVAAGVAFAAKKGKLGETARGWYESSAKWVKGVFGKGEAVKKAKPVTDIAKVDNHIAKWEARKVSFEKAAEEATAAGNTAAADAAKARAAKMQKNIDLLKGKKTELVAKAEAEAAAAKAAAGAGTPPTA